MKWLSVASRCGAGLAVALFAGTAAFANAERAVIVAQPVFAGLTTEQSSAEGTAGSGSYTVDDSEALLRLLDAPAPLTLDDSEQVPHALQVDLTSLQTKDVDLFDRIWSPEAKSEQAWDFQTSTVVPEPSTAVLMGLGLAAFAAFRNRFFRATQ